MQLFEKLGEDKPKFDGLACCLRMLSAALYQIISYSHMGC